MKILLTITAFFAGAHCIVHKNLSSTVATPRFTSCQIIDQFDFRAGTESMDNTLVNRVYPFSAASNKNGIYAIPVTTQWPAVAMTYRSVTTLTSMRLT